MPRPKPAFWKVAAAFLFCAAGFAGIGDHYWQEHRFHQDLHRLQPIVDQLVASDPRFAKLEVGASSEPAAYVFGSVSTIADLQIVTAKVAEAFGADRARQILNPLRIRPIAATRSGGA